MAEGYCLTRPSSVRWRTESFMADRDNQRNSIAPTPDITENPMKLPRSFNVFAGLLLALIVLATLFAAIAGWNWLRGPIERLVTERTGRALVINGDLSIKLGWPLPVIRATSVTFANPDWAAEKQMMVADTVEITVDLLQLLGRHLVLPEVRLEHPTLFLEQGINGRKNWLLDLEQKDETARIEIGRLSLDQGMLGYDDLQEKTRFRSELSTSSTAAVGEDLTFTAQGMYKGRPVKANGQGGSVLALRDENTPYPLKVDLTIGRTSIKAEGTITSLLKFTAMDMRLELQGESLAQLYPLLGIAFPETRTYTTAGHLVHSERRWRYEPFTGQIGDSDMAGSLDVQTGGARPVLNADLVSVKLDFADLGPLIGVRPGKLQAAQQSAVLTTSIPEITAVTPERARILPDVPFKTDRWDSVDAEVSLKAKTIRRAEALPLENLDTHLSLRDSVLTLDPLDFGLAGGHLKGVITLDGRKDPIQAHAQIRARKLLLARLFPTVTLSKASIGEVNGEFDLSGEGNSVRRMLATSSGRLGLIITQGEISRLMMEKAGLHLWEIMELNVAGDQRIKLRCAVADVDVKHGNMDIGALVFDTEITTILGTGRIDLGQERLDLTLRQKTKNTSPLALRSPIHVRGNFANPEVGVDKGPVVARALGAIALGMVNPLLALLPLIDAGPGADSDCRQLVDDARAMPPPERKKASAQK